MLQKEIATHLSSLKRTEIQPRYIEAYMRIEHPTLDALSKSQFRKEILISIACFDIDGIDNAEALALSFGL